jgi:hypothetical protein
LLYGIIKNCFCSHIFHLLFSEEAVGAVIQAYVLAKSSEKARGLWEDMASGKFGADIVHGPTICHAVILDCIQNNSWSDAMAIYDGMKTRRVIPLDSTYVGLLLASFKDGGCRRTTRFLEQELVQAKVPVNAEICMMAIRVLIPGVANVSFADMRSQLHSLNDDDKESVYAPLIRAIRSAELEEQRESTKGLPRAKINERRAAAWHEVLKQLAKSSGALLAAEDGGGAKSS